MCQNSAKTAPDMTQIFHSENYSYVVLSFFSAIISCISTLTHINVYIYSISDIIPFSQKKLLPVNISVRCWNSCWLCTYVHYRNTWRTRQVLLSLIFLSKSITVTKEIEKKKENVKKYNYSVKALADNSILLKERNPAHKLFSPGECCNRTETPEMFCACILPIANAHDFSKPDSSNIAKNCCQPLSIVFVDHFCRL